MRRTTAFLIAFVLLFSQITILSAQEETSLENPQISSVEFFINDEPVTMENEYIIHRDCIYVPVLEIAELLKIQAETTEYFSNSVTILKKDSKSAYLYNDNHYAIINKEAVDMAHPTLVKDDVLYMPCTALADIFEIEYTLTLGADDSIRVYFTNSNADAAKYESIIKERKLTSSTAYLIWVSKANYSVRLFKKDSKGVFRFQTEYPCGIGAVSTPTCEGVFKYYEKITAWKYSSYYVGPVMRFNRGYALHSTLMRYNGVPYDDRVGIKLSHGCVRMHQPDIQYLWDTVPLQTTVYVSAD